jgi:hypothetical protein
MSAELSAIGALAVLFLGFKVVNNFKGTENESVFSAPFHVSHNGTF